MIIQRFCVTLGALLAVSLSVATIRSHAQATTASIHGTVTDSSGAVLAGAVIKAENTSTGISANDKTDSKGYFIFPDLHIGAPYSITVDDSGLQRFIASGITLDLSSAREINARLQVGTSAETVHVDSTRV